MFKKITLALVISILLISSSYANIPQILTHKEIPVRSNGTYAVFEGVSVYGEPGEPVLPLYSYTFLLPPAADLNNVSVQVDGLAEEVLSGTFNVGPGALEAIQNKIVMPEGKNIVDGKDIAIYSRDSFFPDSYASITNIGKMRQYKLVKVTVNPYVYNPVSKKLKRMVGGKLVVDFPGMATGPDITHTMPIGTAKLVKKLAVNYNEVAHEYAGFVSSVPERRGLAIITTSSIESGSQKLQNYITMKEKKGYDVHLITDSWTSSKLRSWMKDNYESLNIEFALLIGNPTTSSGDVPMYMNSKTPTEWYYQELSGSGISSSDVYAEVHIGRIPVYTSGDIQKLDNILEKTIAYENANKDDIGWRFKVLLSMKPIDDRTQAYELGEQIKDHTLIPCNWEYYRIYADDYNLNPPPEVTSVTSSNTQKAWKDEQPGCVFWDTHGSSTSSSGMISVNDVDELDDTHPVITFQGACLNAKPDVENNLCYSILVNGGIATHGGTISVTYSSGESDYTNTGSIGGQNYWYAKFLIQDSLVDAEAMDMARIEIDGKKWNNHLALVLFGDPTISPYSCMSLPFVQMTSPNGGERWERDRTFQVTWLEYVEGDVKIDLLKGTSLFQTLISAIPADSSLSWNIPANFELGTDYKIKIYSLTNDTCIDESDDFFSIEEKSNLAVTWPNGGETLEKDTEYELKWDDNIPGQVTIDLLKNTSVYTNIVASTESDGAYIWKVPEQVISGTEYKVRVTSIEKEWLLDESNDVISIQSPLCAIPYYQSFDDFDTGSVPLKGYWEQLDQDDLDWTVWRGPTPSRIDDPPDETGPEGDNTSGDGNYLYTEASFGNNNKKIDMLTPMFDFKPVVNAELSFYYHMFDLNDSEMGTLYMDIWSDGTWENDVITISGDQGDQWHDKTLNLDSYVGKEKIQFRFRGETGDGWHSDISIDDFRISGAVATESVKKQNRGFYARYYKSRLFYRVPNSTSPVSITLYNLQGKLIRTLVDETKTRGDYHVTISNKKVAAGLYLIKMKVGEYRKTIKILHK